MRCVCLLSLLLSAAGILAQSPNSSRPAANDLVRTVVHKELRIEDNDHSHWSYQEIENLPAPAKTRIVVQTPNGDINYLDAIDGRPLTPQQKSAEAARMQRFISNAAQQRKARSASASDDKKSSQLFAMLPNAFLFEYAQDEGNNVKLTFRPNPNFTSHSMEAYVFHKMDGFVIVNRKENRLVEISGRLTNGVEFAGGLFGHLDKGGTFDVKREEVAPDYWAITRMKVNMNGKILFFKTISEHQDEIDRDYRRIGDHLTLAEAAAMARKEGSTLAEAPASNLPGKPGEKSAARLAANGGSSSDGSAPASH
jgi:hypothetical protein